MSSPAPALTDWVEIGSPGIQGPVGPVGVAGAAGAPGAAGASVIRAGAECATISTGVGYATWTWIQMSLSRQDGGFYMYDVNNLVVPVTGYYVLDALVHIGTVSAASNQMQLRILRDASVSLAHGQLQTQGPALDDFVRASAVRWLVAGQVLNLSFYADNGSGETASNAGYLTAALLG